MKVKVTITGYYNIPDDPKVQEIDYGTTDIDQMLAIDRGNAKLDLYNVSQWFLSEPDITLEVVENPITDGRG